MLAFIRGFGLVLICERGKVRVKDPKQSKVPYTKDSLFRKGKILSLIHPKGHTGTKARYLSVSAKTFSTIVCWDSVL